MKLLSMTASLVGAAMFSLAGTASAGLVFDAAILASAQGFGTAPRDLTLQANPNAATESGGVGVNGSGIVFGSVIPDASVFMGNGVSNLSGTDALPNPLADNQKYGIPTIGSLGITQASQIGVLFNATEESGDSVNVLDVTLKFYKADGTFLGAIDGQQNFISSNPGNGVAGFTFVIDAIQQPMVNTWLAMGGTTTTMALEAKIGDFSGGPESFLLYNLGAIPEPSSYAMALVSLAGLGFIGRRRRKN